MSGCNTNLSSMCGHGVCTATLRRRTSLLLFKSRSSLLKKESGAGANILRPDIFHDCELIKGPLLWWQLCKPFAFSHWASPGISTRFIFGISFSPSKLMLWCWYADERRPFLITVVIQILATTSQLRKEKRLSVATLNFETNNKEKQQAGGNCLGTEKPNGPVGVCALVWWVQLSDLWFHPMCLCAIKKR